MMKVTDKAFIVRIRRALKEGASIDAIKNEFAFYRESRISEACAKAPDPLTVCKNVLRHARKISPNEPRSPMMMERYSSSVTGVGL